MFNLSYRRIGGLRFLKIGRLTFSFSIARKYKPVRGNYLRPLEA